ncbi:hypothetical protein CYMTET_51010 [Cymbomonas tetramitiformis]|uniref:Uncharacterized protein n=1 Tax=Cymbomonas tetramitiformis TaxID=36881 RepID=A0AAE0BN85_9CHLO|nr:hypothetical protein CYMTET_51010 [Cymbomonas tetramitiformis]
MREVAALCAGPLLTAAARSLAADGHQQVQWLRPSNIFSDGGQRGLLVLRWRFPGAMPNTRWQPGLVLKWQLLRMPNSEMASCAQAPMLRWHLVHRLNAEGVAALCAAPMLKWRFVPKPSAAVAAYAQSSAEVAGLCAGPVLRPNAEMASCAQSKPETAACAQANFEVVACAQGPVLEVQLAPSRPIAEVEAWSAAEVAAHAQTHVDVAARPNADGRLVCRPNAEMRSAQVHLGRGRSKVRPNASVAPAVQCGGPAEVAASACPMLRPNAEVALLRRDSAEVAFLCACPLLRPSAEVAACAQPRSSAEVPSCAVLCAGPVLTWRIVRRPNAEVAALRMPNAEVAACMLTWQLVRRSSAEVAACPMVISTKFIICQLMIWMISPKTNTTTIPNGDALYAPPSSIDDLYFTGDKWRCSLCSTKLGDLFFFLFVQGNSSQVNKTAGCG